MSLEGTDGAAVMIPFGQAFLGKASASGVNDVGAKKLERKLQRHRQQRSRASGAARTEPHAKQPVRVDCGVRAAPQALWACSHSDINTAGAQLTGGLDQAAASGHPLGRSAAAAELAPPSLINGAQSSGGPRMLEPLAPPRHQLSSKSEPDVGAALSRRGELLCARMSAAADQLADQLVTATRSGSRGRLAPLRSAPRAKHGFNAWGGQQSLERDRRPRRKTVPETAEDGGGIPHAARLGRVASLDQTRVGRLSTPGRFSGGGGRGSLGPLMRNPVSTHPAFFSGRPGLRPIGGDGRGATQYRVE